MRQPRRRRWWPRRKRFAWSFDADPGLRCWCGYWPPGTAGNHDRRFVGHAPGCPVAVFTNVTTQAELDGQWETLERWAQATARLGDFVDWQRTYLLWSVKLYERAVMLRLELPSPVPDNVGV